MEQEPAKFSAKKSIQDRAVEERIGEILGIPANGHWVISGNLDGTRVYLVNPKDDSALKDYGWLKGIMVDTSAGTLVAKSFGYTATAVANDMNAFIQTEGTIELEDDLRVKRVLDLGKTTLLQGYEGTVIRIGKYQGRVFVSTARVIDLGPDSKWGSCPPFLDLYQSQGGTLDPDVLFPGGADTYNYVHIIIISSTCLYSGSKCPVPPEYTGFNVYLGRHSLWDIENPPYAKYRGEAEEGGKLKPYVGSLSSQFQEFETTSSFEEACHTKKFLAPPVLSGLGAYEFLRYGYYPLAIRPDIMDGRLIPGEFLVAVYTGDDGSLEMMKIASKAYTWRNRMSGQNPKVEYGLFMHRDVMKMDLKTARDVEDQYLPLYPIIETNREKVVSEIIASLIPFLPVATLADSRDYTLVLDKRDRMINVWLAYFASLHPSKQKEGLEAYKEMEEDIANALTFYTDLVLKKIDTGESLRKTSQRMVKDANTKLADWIKASKTKKTEQQKEEKLRSIFEFIFSKMPAVELYTVIADMKKYIKFVKSKEVPKQQESPKQRSFEEILKNYDIEFPKVEG